VALADLNGDGKPDIVTADSGSSGVSVLLGKGDGTFAGQAEYATGKAPAGVALADLNGDGKPDIVTANAADNDVSVLLNTSIATGAGSTVVKHGRTGQPPLATTGPVGEIAGTYVTLTGTVLSQGPGSFYFQYGASRAYGSATPTLQLGSSTSPQQLAATLSLSAGATYHYRIVATNLVGTALGGDQVFTVPPEAPLLRALEHGRLTSVLEHGLRLRVSDTAPSTIDLKLLVNSATARATHLTSSKRRAKVAVGNIRVSVAANHGRTVTVELDAAARRRLASLGRLRLTVSATASTANGVAGAPTRLTVKLRR
jgi:hypothetical protein